MDHEEMKEMLREHDSRIKGLEEARIATLKAISDLDAKHEQRINSVKTDLRERIDEMARAQEVRDEKTTTNLQRLETKLDSAVTQLRKSTPPWVGIAIGAILAGAGWIVEIAIKAGH